MALLSVLLLGGRNLVEPGTELRRRNQARLAELEAASQDRRRSELRALMAPDADRI